jgi:hypothetical protein
MWPVTNGQNFFDQQQSPVTRTTSCSLANAGHVGNQGKAVFVLKISTGGSKVALVL